MLRFIVSTGLMGQKQNVVKTDLFSAILRTGVLKYERALNEDMSFQLGAFYTGYSPRGTDVRLTGYRNYTRIQVLPVGEVTRLPMEPTWHQTSAI